MGNGSENNDGVFGVIVTLPSRRPAPRQRSVPDAARKASTKWLGNKVHRGAQQKYAEALELPSCQQRCDAEIKRDFQHCPVDTLVSIRRNAAPQSSAGSPITQGVP